MKIVKIILAALCLQLSICASAYDFKVDRLYYNIISVEDQTVEVTYLDKSYNADYVKGGLIIPEQVVYANKTYKVTSIGDGSFYGCSKLTSVEIPNTVTSIGSSAFIDCDRLKILEIPNSVTSIGDEAFWGCDGLTSVEIPNSVTEIGRYAFCNCDGLTSIDIPSSVTSIGGEAFSECKSLTNVTIGNSVTEIGEYAFYCCGRLTSLTIGRSVKAIGEYAFSGCSAIKEVYCMMETPVEIEAEFPNRVLNNAVLYVPKGTKDEYEMVYPWSAFSTIEEFDATGISGVTVSGGQFVTVDGGTIKVDNTSGQIVNVYTVGGQCVYSGTDSTISNLAKGVYVVKSGDNVAKIILK